MNEFKAFSVDPGANVLSQVAYEALPALIADGFLSGIAVSEQFNKVWRQANVPGVALTDLVAATLGEDVLDDGNVAALAAQMSRAIQILGGAQPVRIVTSSANFNILDSDGYVGLNRTAALSTTQATLPTPLVIGQVFGIEDLVGNFNSYPVTVVPPGGMTIAGLSTAVLNVNRQSATFRYYGSNLFGVKF